MAISFVELHINLNNLCVNSSYSILRGDTIREFVSPLSSPKGEVFISEIKKLGGSLCLCDGERKCKIMNVKLVFSEMKSSFSHEKNLCETSSYSILRGDIIREFVSPLNPPKGEVHISEIKKRLGSLCLCAFVAKNNS